MSTSKDHKGQSASWLKGHSLEGDGAVHQLFHHLWKKNRDLATCPVWIPDTIVYEHNFPRGWYTFDNKGSVPEIKKKTGKELETNTILREFSKPVHPNCEIVASYLSKLVTDGSSAAGPGEVIQIEFFDAKELNTFLTKREKREQGILQRFVMPKDCTNNSVVQAIWSPHVTLVERRTNSHKLSDHRFTMYERAVTYEGAAHHSTEVFCAPQLVEQIKEICQEVVQHFFETEHKHISRMVLYFKVDPNSNPWLLWSSSIRVADKYQISRTMPLNLFPKFFSPDEARSAGPGGAPTSAHQQRRPHDTAQQTEVAFTCPGCGEHAERPYDVPLEKVIVYEARRMRRPGSPATSNGSPGRPMTASSLRSALIPIGSSAVPVITTAAGSSPSARRPPRSPLSAPLQRSGKLPSIVDLKAGDTSSCPGSPSAISVSGRSAYLEDESEMQLLDSTATNHLSSQEHNAASPSLSSSTLHVPGELKLDQSTISPQQQRQQESQRQQIASFLNDQLDDLLYEAYSHFLHNAKPFKFTLPSAFQAYKERLEPLFTKFKIAQIDDTNEYTLSTANGSVGKMQRDFQELKDALRRMLNESAAPTSRIPSPPPEEEHIDEDSLLSVLRSRRVSRKPVSVSAPIQKQGEPDLVPPLVRKFLPDITNTEFKKLAEEPIFLGRSAEFCETCFLKFTERQSEPGTLIKVDPWQKVPKAPARASSASRTRPATAGLFRVPYSSTLPPASNRRSSLEPTPRRSSYSVDITGRRSRPSTASTGGARW